MVNLGKQKLTHYEIIRNPSCRSMVGKDGSLRKHTTDQCVSVFNQSDCPIRSDGRVDVVALSTELTIRSEPEPRVRARVPTVWLGTRVGEMTKLGPLMLYSTVMYTRYIYALVCRGNNGKFALYVYLLRAVNGQLYLCFFYFLFQCVYGLFVFCDN